MRQAAITTICLLGCLFGFGSTTFQAHAAAKAWYEGGNLHKKTGLEWLEASTENRLATSADFVVTLLKPKSMAELEGMKPKAVELSACITKSYERPKNMSTKKWAAAGKRPATEIAVACAILLGYR